MAQAVHFEGKQALRWLHVKRVLVAYMETDAFDDGLWDDWIAAFGQDGITGMIIGSWGATQPSHQQWRRATREMRDRSLPVAVVTEARHNLALAKAASWVGTNIRAFRWHDAGEASDFVGVPEALRPVVRAKLVALRDRFGAVAPDVTLGREEHQRRDYAGAGALEGESVFASSSEIQDRLDEIQGQLRRLRASRRARTE